MPSAWIFIMLSIEDGGPCDGVVDGEEEPLAAAGEDKATASAAAKAPVGEVLEEDIGPSGDGGQIGVPAGGGDEAEIGAAAGEKHVATVGEDEAEKRGATERFEAAEDGGVGGNGVPALLDEGGVGE
nr:unnamed protein product [Digitaria exilis]